MLGSSKVHIIPNHSNISIVTKKSCYACVPVYQGTKGSQKQMPPPFSSLYIFIEITTAFLKSLNILDHFLAAATVSVDIWRHHS